MDLQQLKLSKSEWQSIEVPVSDAEKNILLLITRGYNNVNIMYNANSSLLSYLKIEHSDIMEDYLYNKFFLPFVDRINKLSNNNNFSVSLCLFFQ